MLDRLWDLFVETLMFLFMPAVCSYYAISGNLFLNTAVQNTTGLEALGDTLLIPVQYLLVGKEAIEQPDGSWKFTQRFDYTNAFWVKTTGSIIALPCSLVLGSLVKGISFCDCEIRNRFTTLQRLSFHSNLDDYAEMGLQTTPTTAFFQSKGFQRRPGDEHVLASEKKALQEIVILLNKAKIPWWLDCGSCLGAYRHGGIIPWDEDIDVAVLLPDFSNMLAILRQLDPKKYLVQDWSTRDYPDSLIKVFIRETGTMIDIYHFDIFPKERELRFVFALDNHLFFPEWFKIRERRFQEPVSFDTVFPLKKALFDGIEVFVPNDPKKYLQRCYGENLDPVKIYNPNTGRYEKNLAHPYWQRAYVH